MKLIITIDGYSSCGKSTIAKDLAKHLGYTYIDSGAMYRAVTLFCLRNNVINNETINPDFSLEKLSALLNKINISFKYNNHSKRYETYLNNENVEDEIRSMNVSDNVSIISKIKIIREKMVRLQHQMGKDKNIIMEGRDIGTVVFPDAALKIFVTAEVNIRATRRYKELSEKGISVSFQQVKENIIKRDYIDENRKESPLKKADDAILLDNSNMTREEQLNWAIQKVNIFLGNHSHSLNR